MGSTYNITGSLLKLNEMVKHFKSLRVTDRWKTKLLRVTDRWETSDWNIVLPDDPEYEDLFTDWCEDNGIEYNLV